jgi:hypothetical protein
MSGESPKKIGRGHARDREAGQFQLMIDSWDLHLRAEKKKAKTIRTAARGAPTARRARELRIMLQLAKRSAVARTARGR